MHPARPTIRAVRARVHRRQPCLRPVQTEPDEPPPLDNLVPLADYAATRGAFDVQAGLRRLAEAVHAPAGDPFTMLRAAEFTEEEPHPIRALTQFDLFLAQKYGK